MIAVRVAREPGNRYVPLLVAGTSRMLVEEWMYIEPAFEGLLASPTPFPDAESCEEIRYSFLRDDGVDLLTEDTPVAGSISGEDRRRLEEGMQKLKASRRKAQVTERGAIASFRLPDSHAQSDCYRKCVDPSTGAEHLVVLWGLAVCDDAGNVLAAGPGVDTPMAAMAAVLPPVAGGAATGGAGGARGVPAAAPGAYAAPYPYSAAPSRCKAGLVGLLLLLLIAGLAGLGYWWSDQERQKLAAEDTKLRDDLDEALKELKKHGGLADGLKKEVEAETRQALVDIRDGAKKMADDAVREARPKVAKAVKTAADEAVPELVEREAREKVGKLVKEQVDARIADEGRKRLEEIQKAGDVQVARVQKAGGDRKLDTVTLKDDVQVVRNRLAGLERDTEAGLARGREDLLLLLADNRDMWKCINELYSFHPDQAAKAKVEAGKEGKTLAATRKRMGEAVTLGDYTGFEAKIKQGEEIPALPEREVRWPEGLPEGVQAPKQAKDLRDLDKWTIPEGTGDFRARAVLVGKDGAQEEVTVWVRRGKKEIVVKEAPKVTWHYEVVNDEDHDAVEIRRVRKGDQWVEEVAFKEGAKKEHVDLRRTGVDEHGTLIESDLVRVDRPKEGGPGAPKPAMWVRPLTKTWTKVSGDAEVPSPHVGWDPPPLLKPVANRVHNTYDVKVVDKTGKLVSHETKSMHRYLPPKKEE